MKLGYLLAILLGGSLSATPLGFEETIDRALSTSRSIKQSQLDAHLAKNNALKNVTLMTPSISLGWTNTHFNSAIVANFGGQNITIRPQQQSPGFIQAVQSISPIIGLIQKLRADYQAQKAAETGSQLAQAEIAFGCAQAYRQLQQLKAIHQIAQDRVQLGIRQQQDAQAIFESGRISKNDFLRVKMALSQAKVAVIDLQTQYETAWLSFKDLLDYDPTDNLELASLSLSGNQIPKIISLPDSRLRLDIQAAQFNYESKKEIKWLSILSFLPSLNGFARIDKNFTDAGSFQASYFYSAGLTLSWDLWDGGGKILDISSSSVLAHKSRLQLVETQRKAYIEKEQRKLELKSALESLELQKIVLEQAQESYEGTSERFKQGSISVTDLLLAELNLNNSKVNWTQAIINLDIKNMLLQKSNGYTRPESLL